MDNNNCNQNNHIIKTTEEINENVLNNANQNVDVVDSSECTVTIDLSHEQITNELTNIKLEPTMNMKPLGNDETGTRSNMITNNGTTNHNNVTNNGHNKNSVSAAKKNAFYKQQPFDEYFIPVNEHRKFIRGEKLYLTMDKRDNKRGFAKYFCYLAAFLIFSIIVITAILAAIGVIFNHEINHDYIEQSVSSRQFRPNIKTAGHSISYSNGNKNLSQFQQKPITEPPIIIITTQTPIITETYSQFEVPNTLEAHVVITNMNFRPEFANKTNPEYLKFIQELELTLRSSLFNFDILTNGMNTIILRIIDIQPGSIKVKFRVGWMYIDKNFSDRIILTKDLLKEKLNDLSMSNFDNYQLDPDLIKVQHVSDMCEINNNNCDEKCSFDFLSLDFQCTCFDGRKLVKCSQPPTTTEIVNSTTEEIITKISITSTTESDNQNDIITESIIDDDITTVRDETTALMSEMKMKEKSNDITTEYIIPLVDDALEHENPIEENPDMGSVIERDENSETFDHLVKTELRETTVDNLERPTIEMLIVEKETTNSLLSTSTMPAIIATQTTIVEPRSENTFDIETEFLNELYHKFSTINLSNSTESVSIQENIINESTTKNIMNEIVTTEYFEPVQINKCTSSSTQFECINNTINNNNTYCIDNDYNNCEIINKNDTFLCIDKNLIDKNLVCNGVNDCTDGDDEVNCSKLKCLDSEFYCDKENQCIRNTLICNGNWDCLKTGSDELSCNCSSIDQFKCKSGGGCIEKNQICDGIEQCPDLSDEWNCFKISNIDNSSIIEIRTMHDDWLPICSINWNNEFNDMLCEKLGYLDSIQSDFITRNNSNFKYFQITNTFNDTSKNILKMIDVTDNCDSILSLHCREFNCGNHQGSDMITGQELSSQYSSRNWPSIAVIYNEIENLKCIATLIAPKWLISTYSCFEKDQNVNNWKVNAGLNSGLETKDLKRFIIHPQVKYNKFTYENDIILIELEDMFVLNENLDPICLPQNNVHNQLICLTVTSKNDTTNNTDTDILNFNYIVTQLYNNSECKDQLNEKINENDRICAQKLCNINEGAPIVCFAEDSSVLELQGLLSNHQSCNLSQKPNLYTKINEDIKQWIMNSIGISFATNTRFHNNY